MDTLKKLKENTGCSSIDCKKSLILSNNNYQIAYNYLLLKSSAVARYKIINGQKIKWNDTDFILAAKKEN